VVTILVDKAEAEVDWQSRLELGSKLGKFIAVKSEKVNRTFCQEKGGDLFLMYGPQTHFVQYFTPQEVDLEPIYHTVKELDPEASWFLHQSHHMVICGSGSAPDSKTTKLTFEQLIEVVKSV